MPKKTTRKLPTYMQLLDGRYFVRVPVKPELRPYVGSTELREALGPDLRIAKENLHAHVAIFKQKLREAAEAYRRGSGKEVPISIDPVDPTRLMVRHYRDVLAFDEEARNHDHRYSAFGYVDELFAERLRKGIAGSLSDQEYLQVINGALAKLQRAGESVPMPGSDDFRPVARAICLAEYEGLSRIAERDEGDFAGKPENPALVAAIEQAEIQQQVDDQPVRLFDTWTLDRVIEEQQRLAAMGLGRPKSTATLEKYRTAQYDFEHFRKDKKVATITLADGKAWRDHMLTNTKLSRKSVHDKITIIRSLMNEANRQAENQMFPGGDPWAALEMPNVIKGDSADRTYTLKDARHFLEFARTAHRTSFRWIPWIIAHTGARVNEITPLEREDIEEKEGYWFIHIRVDGDRTTKTGKARKVPVHHALINEGFIEWVKQQPPGRLFPGGKNKDQRLREWIHEKVFPKRDDLPPPNHGFRHLFEDALYAGVSQKAALYITGRSSGSSADDYGGSDLRLIEIAKQMGKVRDIIG
jgi:integrase